MEKVYRVENDKGVGPYQYRNAYARAFGRIDERDTIVRPGAAA